MAIGETTIASAIRLLLLLPYTSGHMKKTPQAFEMLAQSPNRCTAFLREDLGLFAGYEARRLFAEILAHKLPLRNGRPWYNATFQDHYRHFGVTLAVTGTNFETKKGGEFSWENDPQFPGCRCNSHFHEYADHLQPCGDSSRRLPRRILAQLGQRRLG
jgi:hypothetical protein